MPTMEIREATRADEPAVTTDLLVPGFRDSAEHAPEYNELDEAGVADAGVDRWLDHEDRVLFVADRDDTLVGYISAVRAESPPVYARGDRTHVDGLYVAEGHRREGVASALFDRVEAWARDRNCEYLGVAAHVENDAAIEMYDDAFDRTYVSYRRRLGDE